MNYLKRFPLLGKPNCKIKTYKGKHSLVDKIFPKEYIEVFNPISHFITEYDTIWDEFSNDREKLAYESINLMAHFSKKKIEDIIEFDEIEVIDGKEKIRLIKTRVNQCFFRDSILGIYDNRCCITGLTVPKLLIASHIIPWSVDVKNRLNPENGLCLNSIHDKAFDEGLITITTDYKVKISDALLDFKKEDAIRKFFMDFADSKISMPDRYFPNKQFLEYHNAQIFIK